MATESEDLLASGGEALNVGDWSAARSAFEAALEQEETAEALFGLGDALWWLGEIEPAVRCRERAYAAFRRRPDPVQAAIVAMRLCLTYRANLGSRAASRGWLRRAARMVEDFELDALRGWVALMRANDAEDPVVGERLAREAHAFARESGDADLELCALSEIGAWLVELGRVAEGVALLDEAMAASLGGEGGSLNTVVYTSCHTIISCSRAADFERAAQWFRAIDGFSGRYGCPLLYTMCRTLYAGVLFADARGGGAPSRTPDVEHRRARALRRGAREARRAAACAGQDRGDGTARFRLRGPPCRSTGGGRRLSRARRAGDSGIDRNPTAA
ncbi:MAG: tetratricopeptide repeat protein [Thermoleophilaceae bacterium]